MKIIIFIVFLYFNTLLCVRISITADEAREIGQKVWMNECAGTIDGLTSWNEQEDFASLGIGHFIWYPKNYKEHTFKDTFPALLTFLERHGHPLPAGILSNGQYYCPWTSRDDFKAHVMSEQMIKLRQFLADTIDLQITFMVQRLQKVLPTLLKAIPSIHQKKYIEKQFNRIVHTPGGLYALIDYLNFKGEGTEPFEAYNGHRWGLLKVLETMQETPDALSDFAQAAKKVLQTRIANAPAGRDESRWWPGWEKRINTYIVKK